MFVAEGGGDIFPNLILFLTDLSRHLPQGLAKFKDVASKLFKATGSLMFVLTPLSASSRCSGSEADVWGVVFHPGGDLSDCVFPTCPSGLITWTGL